MEDWAAAGYPNHATAVMAEKTRLRKEEEERMRQHKAKLAADARAKLQPPGSATRVFTTPPKF